MIIAKKPLRTTSENETVDLNSKLSLRTPLYLLLNDESACVLVAILLT